MMRGADREAGAPFAVLTYTLVAEIKLTNKICGYEGIMVHLQRQ